MRLQLIADNPAERATLPPRPRATSRVEAVSAALRPYGPEQLRAFLQTASGHRLFALFHLAVFTGARRGELLHLRWQDLRLEKGEVLIAGSRTGVGGLVVEGTTKGGRARIVSLDEGTVDVMRPHRARQLEERLAAGALWDETDDFVLPP